MRAVVANVLHHGISQGGWTITQRLAKNLFLTPERHLMRKLQEAVLALWLEHKFTKSEIIELYLGRMLYFGSGAYGVEAAAQRYFGKSARRVTAGEAALLAGLVKSPARLTATKNLDAAERRLPIGAHRHGGGRLHQGGHRQGRDGGGSGDREAERRRNPGTPSPTG